ncbi:hypothetical protein M758_UG291900 [Ceratodon purpureus]|nr:hypothetical protein M758_UG291900 [Ceratodon purpureus]
MRKKWWRCRCSPPTESMLCRSKCRCLLLLPTQEYIMSPDSNASLPSEFVDSDCRESSPPDHVTLENMESIYRLMSRMKDQGRLLSAKFATTESIKTVPVLDRSITVHLQHSGSPCSRCGSAGFSTVSDSAYEDTASSENSRMKRPSNSSQYESSSMSPGGEKKPCTKRGLVDGS